jgi:cysteine dioxygenase
VATETLLVTSDNALVYPTTSRELVKGSISLSEDDDKHQISNLQAEGELVTLHIYSPPLLVMGKYSLTTGTVTDFTDPVFEFSHGTGI